MILRPGQARIALRPAHDETARGVDVVFRLFVQQLGGDDRADHMLQIISLRMRLQRHLRSVLGGNDHSVHPHGRCCPRIPQSPGSCRPGADSPACPSLRTSVRPLCQLVRQRNGQRHQLRCLVGRRSRTSCPGRPRPPRRPPPSRPWRYRGDCSSTLESTAHVSASKPYLARVIADVPHNVAHNLRECPHSRPW